MKDTEKSLQLKARISEIVTKVKNLQTSLQICIEAKAAMKKIDTDKGFFTEADIDTEIKLLKRKIKRFESLKLKVQVKIETLLIEEIHLDFESFETSLLELRFQEKETSQAIQNLELAIDKLEKMAQLFQEPTFSLENFYLFQQIQLLKNNKLVNESKLKNVEKKIEQLKQPKASQNAVTSQVKQLFFNRNREKSVTETELIASKSLAS